MARIVLTSFGSYGDLYPYLGLGRTLQARGHDVVLAMPEVYRAHAARARLEFAAIRPDLDIEDRALIARIMDRATGAEALLGELLAPRVRDSFADLYQACEGADLLLTHPGTLAGPLVGDARRMRWASSVLAPLSFFSVHDPIVPPPAPWVYQLTSRSLLLSRVFLWLSERMTRRWIAPVFALRRELNVPDRGNPVIAGQHSPHLVLAMFSRVLAQPQPDWPPHTRVTGAVFYRDPEHDLLPPALEQFLAAGPPPLVFTLGTSAVETAGRFYEVSAAAAQQLGQRAVLLIGRHAANRPRHLSDDVIAVDFASHAQLFARGRVIVHQGGAGTLQQALLAGRPMLVVPHAHDQADNARRAVRIGVGRTIAPGRYDPARLVGELRPLLDDPRYVTAATALARDVQAEDGAATAADALEVLLDRPWPAHTDRR